MIKKINTNEKLRSEVLHQVFMNLEYETSASRTLRECGIDHIDITRILIRSGVLPRGTKPVVGKYDTNITIQSFVNQIVTEYGTEIE